MSDPEYSHIGTPVGRLIEECSELIQALCKAERFGWFNHHPDHPERTNFDDIRNEMNDVVESIKRLEVYMCGIAAGENDGTR